MEEMCNLSYGISEDIMEKGKVEEKIVRML